jgi:hypothetical protein
MAARQRRSQADQPGTPDVESRHARPTPNAEQPATTGWSAEAELEDFANWFADWWLRRGRDLVRADTRCDAATSESLDSRTK